MNHRPSSLAFAMLKCGVALSAISLPLAAFAQDTEAPATAASLESEDANGNGIPDKEETSDGRPIVVTGTSIRGIQPAGSNAVQVSEEQIEATGVTDTNQLLAQLPQGTYFNRIPQPAEGAIQQGTSRAPINRPNLRNIPFQTNTSGAPTLVLIDGHRVVTSGTEQAVVEPGVVPTSILGRVEVILDGASAVYGSDAVGGVINFITKKRLDGIDAGARYGFADDYWQADASVTAGKSWESGGISLTYEFAQNSNILSGERDHQTPLNWIAFNPPQVDDLNCAISNVRMPANTGTLYSVSGNTLALGPQYCAANEFETYIPASRRHSGFGVFSQDLMDGVTFEMTGLYSNRVQTTNSGPFQTTFNVAPTNPNYRPVPGLPAAQQVTQQVFFDYSAALGTESREVSTLHEIWQVTPELTVDIGSEWQGRALFAYGESTTRVERAAIDTSLQNSRLTSGLINPYNVAASGAGAFDNLFWTDRTEGRHDFTQLRMVADGPLLSLPGGQVSAAVGAEWLKYGFARQLTGQVAPFAPSAVTRGEAESIAAFGELSIPIFSSENAQPGLAGLLLSLSGRYDQYESFGGTFNPRIALTYNPVDWITVRGNWNTSFRAPNAVDDAASTSNTIRCLGQNANTAFCPGTGVQVPPGRAATDYDDPDQVFLFLTGTDPNVGPESAESWSIGLDINPPILPGLVLSVTYWDIDFKDVISTPLVGASLQPVFLGFPEAFVLGAVPAGLTQAQINEFLALGPQGPTIRDALNSTGYRVMYFIDGRVQNLGGAKISGVDLSARLRQPVPFGSIDANVNVTIPIRQKLRLAPVGPETDNLAFGTPRWLMNASVGADIGNFRVQTLVRHTPGFKFDPATNPPTTRLASQTHAPSFTLVDLAFRYRIEAPGFGEGLTLSLNVNNVFDTDPPLSKTVNGGTVNGQTIGRLIQFGIGMEL